MGYPMTYDRVINRNWLTGDYDPQDHKGLIKGDLRRLEHDMRDEKHIKLFAARAGISERQAAKVLDDFFTGFGTWSGDTWLSPAPYDILNEPEAPVREDGTILNPLPRNQVEGYKILSVSREFNSNDYPEEEKE